MLRTNLKTQQQSVLCADVANNTQRSSSVISQLQYTIICSVRSNSPLRIPNINHHIPGRNKGILKSFVNVWKLHRFQSVLRILLGKTGRETHFKNTHTFIRSTEMDRHYKKTRWSSYCRDEILKVSWRMYRNRTNENEKSRREINTARVNYKIENVVVRTERQ
jgi:hypothetical protein